MPIVGNACANVFPSLPKAGKTLHLIDANPSDEKVGTSGGPPRVKLSRSPLGEPNCGSSYVPKLVRMKVEVSEAEPEKMEVVRFFNVG